MGSCAQVLRDLGLDLLVDVVGDLMRFIKENTECQLLYYNDKLIGVTPPKNVILEVTFTEPAARGNTATNVTKPATVETGAEVAVPLFINVGDMIKIDTRTHAYVERVKK